MRVLVLGATGFVGQRLVAQLRESGWATPVLAGRRPPANLPVGLEFRQVDTLDSNSLRRALADIDAVVNSVAGEGDSISRGARLLVEAALETSRPRIVHMSSMAVYGRQEGQLREDASLDPGASWYARAKCEAEEHMAAYAAAGQRVIMLRPGCIHGPGSDMWVRQIARLLAAGRVGDLGPAGEGWSNLVHVDDVCSAVLLALRHESAIEGPAIFNLAGADSPQWNRYFIDLGKAIGVAPVKSIRTLQLKLDASVGTALIRVLQRLTDKAGADSQRLPVALSPSFLRLWQQALRIDVEHAHTQLKFAPRTYSQSLAESAQWALSQGIGSARVSK